MNARTKQFWHFQAVFWCIAGLALFISGATQMPLGEALVRNLFLCIAGFLTSFFLAIVVDELRWMPILRLRVSSYGLAYVVALFCVIVINAISFTLRGVGLGDITFGQWFSGAMNLGLLYAFWAELFIQKIYQPPVDAGPESTLRIVVEHRGTLVPLDPAEIETITAAGDYVEISSDGKTYLDRQTLHSLESQLARDFVRVHRSVLVNRHRVRAVAPLSKGRYRLTLTSQDIVTSSRGYRDTVERIFLS